MILRGKLPAPFATDSPTENMPALTWTTSYIEFPVVHTISI